MKCAERVFVIDDVLPGTILHDPDHTRQAMLLGDWDSVDGDWVPALIFDLNSGDRMMDSESCINVTHGGWHVADHYTLGMNVPMPPPSIKPVECDYLNNNLSGGATCTCGCGRSARQCQCNYCDSCPTIPDRGEDHCSDCQDHGECSCSCGCSDTTYESGDNCSWCENTDMCRRCEETHDIYVDGLCSYCHEVQQEEDKAEQERIDEEARMEKETADAS